MCACARARACARLRVYVYACMHALGVIVYACVDVGFRGKTLTRNAHREEPVIPLPPSVRSAQSQCKTVAVSLLQVAQA